MALDRLRATDELEAVLRSARDEVDRLSQLAEDLLLLARLDRGALPIRTEAIETQRLLAGIAARFEQRAGGAGLGLAIVAEIAAAHGGAAHAKNLSGGGVDVWIWVPQATA